MEEYLEDGYIKISRRIFNSKTFSHLNAIQKFITIYFILRANWKDNEWWDSYQKKFITIKRGSFVTSVEQIRKDIKSKSVTTQKIRTLLNKLQEMEFLTIETNRPATDQQPTSNRPAQNITKKITKGYTLITIEKYNLYQNGDSYINKPNNKVVTKQQQGSNKALTTNKNVKNVKNDKKEEEKKISFSFKDKKFLNLTLTKMELYEEKYPVIDVYLEIEKMEKWLLSEKVKKDEGKKSKIPKDYNRFIHNWFRKASEDK